MLWSDYGKFYSLLALSHGCSGIHGFYVPNVHDILFSINLMWSVTESDPINILGHFGYQSKYQYLAMVQCI